jgi:anti-sigma B factor antagonist
MSLAVLPRSATWQTGKPLALIDSDARVTMREHRALEEHPPALARQRANYGTGAGGSDREDASMAVEDFAISAEVRDDEVVVDVRGEIDLSTAPLLDQRLSQFADTPKVVVDLSGVTFLDSSGLGVLVRTSNKVETQGGVIRVVVSHPQVLKVLEITGLAGTLPVFRTLNEALSA